MIISLIIAVLTLLVTYLVYTKVSIHKMQDDIYKSQALSMQHELSNLIIEKQKATLALGLSLANDETLKKQIFLHDISSSYYDKLILQLTKETLYKNVWIQILDQNGTSLYRSWTTLKGDSLVSSRGDLKYTLKNPKASYCISVGKFDLSIKGVVPIFHDNKFIGIVEVITHFNSITKTLQATNTDSVVLLQAKYKDQLTYPFSKIFVDDYYVANLNPSKELLAYLHTHNPKQYFNASSRIENGYLIVSSPLYDDMNQELAYFIMFKKLSDLKSVDLELFSFKLTAIFVLFSLISLFFLSSMMFIKNRKQKIYYKNILDSSSNIMIVNDAKQILDANKAFFKYFYQYSSLEEFLKEHRCICELFAEEEGYIQSSMDSVIWTNYILNNPEKDHKIKINYLGNIFYFSVSVSLIFKRTTLYSIVLSDITTQETYQQELLCLSIKDPLTNIYNRHFFNQKIEEEILRAQRYKSEFALIMLDIDFFKKINDLHGHDVGDTVLIEYTKFISEMLRKTDFFCRIGGEEFIIILPQTSLSEAHKLAEKLRYKVEMAKKVLPISMSFGVTKYQEDDTILSIFKRADKALYKAKASGRNCVIAG